MVERTAHNCYVKGSIPFRPIFYYVGGNNLMVECRFVAPKATVQFRFFAQ